MQTKSIMVQTLCVPCACRCRYCLLRWDGHPVGADYDRSQRFAERFHAWVRRERPDLSYQFSFGYSMDHPRLLDAVDFMNRIGSVGGRFLQCDGMVFRDERERKKLLHGLKEHGAGTLNFTFYGTEAYHDRFAGRKGDHAYLLGMMEAASEYGFHVTAGVPLNKENVGQADQLLHDLEVRGAQNVRLFIPHGEGRGAGLEDIRLTQDDLMGISEDARGKLDRKVYQSEAEWCKIKGGEPERHRALIVSLTRDNMDRLGSIPFEEIIAEVEALDEAYYGAFPAFEDLLAQYGDREGKRLYSRRDLFHRCRRQYAKDHGVRVYDVTDERQSGSRRY